MKVITCLADVLDKQKLSDAERKTTDAVPMPSDGERHRMESAAEAKDLQST